MMAFCVAALMGLLMDVAVTLASTYFAHLQSYCSSQMLPFFSTSIDDGSQPQPAQSSVESMLVQIMQTVHQSVCGFLFRNV